MVLVQAEDPPAALPPTYYFKYYYLKQREVAQKLTSSDLSQLVKREKESMEEDADDREAILQRLGCSPGIAKKLSHTLQLKSTSSENGKILKGDDVAAQTTTENHDEDSNITLPAAACQATVGREESNAEALDESSPRKRSSTSLTVNGHGDLSSPWSSPMPPLYSEQFGPRPTFFLKCFMKVIHLLPAIRENNFSRCCHSMYHS
tara:strand:- start:708 stop:1322 length:615 start_codon:yes stop_codon:yes gene_type:complete